MEETDYDFVLGTFIASAIASAMFQHITGAFATVGLGALIMLLLEQEQPSKDLKSGMLALATGNFVGGVIRLVILIKTSSDLPG